jgi:hypothetical protein
VLQDGGHITARDAIRRSKIRRRSDNAEAIQQSYSSYFRLRLKIAVPAKIVKTATHTMLT